MIDLRFPELYASLSGSREEAEQTSVDTDTATVTAVTTKVEKAIIRSSSDSNIHASKQVRNLDMAHDYSTSAGADIILVPSAFTVPTGTAHWLTLLRARAIENQVYVVAAAQYGRHNERRESYGHSVIINPWGDIGTNKYLLLIVMLCYDMLFLLIVSILINIDNICFYISIHSYLL